MKSKENLVFLGMMGSGKTSIGLIISRKLKLDFIDIDNEIFQAKLKNIHFLHLSFNTLPENKRWIMGCQCDYCLQVNKQHKRIQYYKQHNDSNFFYRNQPFSDIAWQNGSLGGYLINYDPLCDSKYEDLTKYALRTNNASLPFQYIY